MASGTVSALHIYPIKSCRGVAVGTATVSAIGFEGDRTWQVVPADMQSRGLTQRKHPNLATVQPELVDGGGLRLAAPGMPTIDVDRPGGSASIVLSHFKVPLPASDAGNDAAAWFSEIIGETVRLVAMPEGSGWRLPGDLDIFGQNAPFSDAAPLLVTAEASLEWLRDRAGEDFGMDRFRPNVVVSGTEPWDEDTWAEFTIGTAELRGVVPWPRCAIPQIDQRTGEHTREPAKVLRSQRWCTEAPTVSAPFRSIVEGSGLFGIGCAIGPVGATIRVGDELTVITTAPPVLSMVERSGGEPAR
jgi:MOSC domain-containing protein